MKIVFVFLLFSSSLLCQGINWGLRFDAIAVNTTSNFATHTSEMKTKMHYPPFFTTPQLIFSINPVKQAGVEFRAGYEFASSDFSGGEYSFYGKYHLYPFLYFMGGVCLKQLATFYPSDRFSNRIGTTFGLPALGIGWNVGKHISLELEYLHTNKRLIEYSDYDFYNESNQNLRRERFLNYVIKLSAGFNWSIYDF